MTTVTDLQAILDKSHAQSPLRKPEIKQVLLLVAAVLDDLITRIEVLEP